MTGPARTRLAKLAPLALGIAVLAAGCASNAPQDTLQPEGPQARQAKEGGPSPRGGPPDAAGTDKMQGRPRPKGIKAGPCILPLHFGRGCGMALPPPRPADRPRDDR